MACIGYRRIPDQEVHTKRPLFKLQDRWDCSNSGCLCPDSEPTYLPCFLGLCVAVVASGVVADPVTTPSQLRVCQQGRRPCKAVQCSSCLKGSSKYANQNSARNIQKNYIAGSRQLQVLSFQESVVGGCRGQPHRSHSWLDGAAAGTDQGALPRSCHVTPIQPPTAHPNPKQGLQGSARGSWGLRAGDD